MDDRIERAQGGCEQALGALIEELTPALFRFIRRFTADAGRAEDLVQDAWLRASAALERFDPARPFLPWLYRIAANLAISEARRQRRRAEVALDEQGVAERARASAADGGGAIARLDLAERDQRVRRAIDALPPLYRAVTVLYYLDDLDLIDAAEVLGIPVGTAKVRLHRARALLRGRLGALVEDEAEGTHARGRARGGDAGAQAGGAGARDVRRRPG